MLFWRGHTQFCDVKGNDVMFFFLSVYEKFGSVAHEAKNLLGVASVYTYIHTHKAINKVQQTIHTLTLVITEHRVSKHPHCRDEVVGSGREVLLQDGGDLLVCCCLIALHPEVQCVQQAELS